MYEVIMYDGGIYRSDELFELIEDVGGVVLMKNRSSQMLTVTMSIPSEDRPLVEALCKDIGGQVREVPLAGTEIAVVGPTLGRHHMPHPICDIAEYLRRCGAITVVMGLARGRGKLTSQINLQETSIIDEYDACVFMLGNFKSCVETKADLLLSKINIPTVLVCGPKPEGIEHTCDAIVYGVGRKASRMREPADRQKLEEVSDRVEEILADKKKALEEDPPFVHPSEIKSLLENYEPINMCLRPAPIVMHLDGLRAKISYEEHREAIENMMVYGRRLGDVCTITPSKINDSSMLIRIKTRSQVEYEDSLKAKQ
ncbi:MAG: methanogenesis marker 7 protein [Candidatus Methanomethylophilus sp.]|jgi:putative methanogenesis marker protein 7|nr:methanogenesis marker 7 protein [Methanomethylophilus sp.]MBQ4368981.1 methanogenesis marker 7 protein [Methanomethylophilus sp.]MBQ4412220.1 methanogenesis marker 7 protein [Methanomethylophilus sp.]MBQ5397591.1 methanogenesis marker 7 protein [Methanomethylophilus sp.]MBQ5447755.1 methanogenesis marker 7 protein [Methanomethylophilus sp.]